MTARVWKTHVGHLFHVVDHLIVALSLLTEPREESFAGTRLEDRPLVTQES